MRAVRIDHVTVVSPDAVAAAATFERLFGLRRAAIGTRADATASAALAIGDARLEFVTPTAGDALAEALRTGGEGLAALTLMVADLDAAAGALTRAGVGFEARTAGGARVLAVDSAAAHGVRLTLMERD